MMFLPHELVIQILLRLPPQNPIVEFYIYQIQRNPSMSKDRLTVAFHSTLIVSFRSILPMIFKLKGHAEDAEYFYGFGYDDSTEDYLVVSMSHHDYDDPSLHLEYFSLKANAWEEVEGPHFSYTFDDEPKGGSLYKGAIHWLAYCDDLGSDVIVAFDLMERKLSYMHLPRHSNGEQCSGLWVYGEFLSVYAKNNSNVTVEIWVMKEYKVNSSWTKTIVLLVDSISSPNEDFYPLCCTKNGDIFGTDEDDGLVKYDKNGRFLEQHSYSNYNLRCDVTMYIDSLLSLPGDGDNE
ncbi:unnamed protein product [Vicia faba]|uniref:F-box associated beta-propeller type 1 domain-containing protein n=1 Tax=Vicia faba TaxID=3906 RepID=A0AAV1ALU3_VICFA|nr:unnamed protein product [Vicia faba]